MRLTKVYWLARHRGREAGWRTGPLETLIAEKSREADRVERVREALAELVARWTAKGDVVMSPSTFHQHFRSLTAMSPLQYQKWLRLSEARRLILAEHLAATTATLKVGYESPSQFSREYRRLFGTPPSRDIASLRRAASS